MNASMEMLFARYDQVVDLVVEKTGMDRTDAMTIGCRLANSKAAWGPVGSDWSIWVSACVAVDGRAGVDLGEILTTVGREEARNALVCTTDQELHELCNGVVPDRWWGFLTSLKPRLMSVLDQLASDTCSMSKRPTGPVVITETDPTLAGLSNARAYELARTWWPEWIVKYHEPLRDADYLSIRLRVATRITRERLETESVERQKAQTPRRSGTSSSIGTRTAEEMEQDAVPTDEPLDVQASEAPADLVQWCAELAGVPITEIVAILDYKRRDQLEPKRDRIFEPIWSLWIGCVIATDSRSPVREQQEAHRIAQLANLGRQGVQVRRSLANGRLPKPWVERIKEIVETMKVQEQQQQSPSAPATVGATIPATTPIGANAAGAALSPTMTSAPVAPSTVQDESAGLNEGPTGESSGESPEVQPSPISSVTRSEGTDSAQQPVASVVEARQAQARGGETSSDATLTRNFSQTEGRPKHFKASVEDGVRYWSPSAVSLFLMCGLAWEFQYLKKAPRKTGTKLIQGSVTHRGIEALCNAKRFGEQHTSEDLARIMLDELTSSWRGEINMDDEERELGEDGLKERIMRRSTLGVVAFRDEILPKIDPIAAEERFRIKTRHGFGLSGVIDLIVPGWIWDWKTGSKKKNQKDADVSLQFSAYYLAYHDKYGTWPDGAGMGSVVVTDKQEKAYTDSITTTRTKEDLGRFLRTVDHCEKLTRQGAFHPADPTSFKCCSDYCDFWNLCDFGAKGRSQRA